MVKIEIVLLGITFFVDPKKKSMFLTAANSGTLNVADYGRILYSGWGEDPSEDIIQKVKEEFDID